MSDCIRGTPENVEKRKGEALAARDKFIRSTRNGLGPPDMCCVYKLQIRPVIPVALQSPNRIGFFHYVLGADVSSAAAVAAYFGEIVNAQEQGWMLSSAHWKIVGGIYCTYDAFTHSDIRIKVTIPGSVSAYVKDSSGAKSPATEEHWQHVSLCTVLRALYGSDPEAHTLTCVRVLPPLPTPASEQRFLTAVRGMYAQGAILGTEDGSTAQAATSRLMSGVVRYFMDSRRYTQAIHFFNQCMEFCLCVVVWVLMHCSSDR